MVATRQRLDAERWHFQHGPMDLLLQAEGEPSAVAAAHEVAWQRFAPLLDALVAELPALRQPVTARVPLYGEVARNMQAACEQAVAGTDAFITPMAAVAGAVAQSVVQAYAVPGIRRAWVNNGGDIALHLAPGCCARVGVYADLANFEQSRAQALTVDGSFELTHAQPVRGVATSGWRGRSWSLGIADSVTVLAATAAQADAAATVIANAVNVPHPAIQRLPANECQDHSDLGALPVTVDVPTLPPEAVMSALAAGLACAKALHARKMIEAAVLVCQGQWRHVQPLWLNPAATAEPSWLIPA